MKNMFKRRKAIIRKNLTTWQQWAEKGKCFCIILEPRGNGYRSFEVEPMRIAG